MNKSSILTTLILLSFLSLALAESNIKEPNIAGQFYPKEPDKLTQMVDGFIARADIEPVDQSVYGIIAPHAGYTYSGPVAGYAYKAIKGRRYDTVVVIGPSHTMRFTGVAIWPEGAFTTPLGSIKIDNLTAKQLVNLNPEVQDNPKAFDREHSLEVHLPFLQRALGDFRLVPLVIGDLNISSSRILAHSLKIALKDKNALVVVSTDLSHDYTYDQANTIDGNTISLIKRGDAEDLYNSATRGSAEMCGLMSVATLLFYAEELGLNKARLLKYANSGDVTGDHRSRIVGYASLIVLKANPREGGEKMFSKEQKERLLKIAGDSISNYFKGEKNTRVSVDDVQLNEEMGAFVTLKIGGRLRGCIGRMVGDQALVQTVSDMASQAAFSDPRFPPLTEAEFKDVDIEISVLSPMKKVSSADEIELGKHGVMVKKGFRTGVFLPQVATETGWSKEEFLSNLCSHKAGLAPDAWKTGEVDILIYTAEVFGEE